MIFQISSNSKQWIYREHHIIKWVSELVIVLNT
jgi:hypothetical protein